VRNYFKNQEEGKQKHFKSLFLNFSWYSKQVVVPADVSGLVSEEKLLNMMIPNEW